MIVCLVGRGWYVIFWIVVRMRLRGGGWGISWVRWVMCIIVVMCWVVWVWGCISGCWKMRSGWCCFIWKGSRFLRMWIGWGWCILFMWFCKGWWGWWGGILGGRGGLIEFCVWWWCGWKIYVCWVWKGLYGNKIGYVYVWCRLLGYWDICW